MEKFKLQPLTDYEKRLAEKSHSLVYYFLHENGYSIEEFYNIAIFGFLRAIQLYSRRKELQKYELSVICYKCMQSEIGNSFRIANAKKRKPAETIISLDADLEEMENLYNCIGGKSFDANYLEEEAMQELLENFSEAQRKIIEMKMNGYSNKEIYMMFGIKPSTYYKEMNRIKVLLMEII